MAININLPIENAVTDGSLNPVTSNAVFDALANKVPNTRNLTINGVTYDLSADRSWVIAATASTLQHEVKAGEAMTKGQAVYVSSADGTNMIVSKASNATEATSSKTMGLIIQNLATNGKGYVITEGLLAGLNTASANAGDPVWLGTGGNLIYGLTNKPAAPAHLVFIGIVTRANVSNGEIFVRVQNGFELQELHNVSISDSVAGGNQLEYDSSTSLWKNVPIQYTIELVAALTVDFYAPYNMKINSVSNVLNAPTITIQDDGAAYTLGNTIAIGSKVTVTASTLSVVNLNITK